MLKKIDPKHIFKTCSSMDPAIDEVSTGKKNFDKFLENHDMKLLKFKEGELPTIFHIKNIPDSRQAEIQEEHYKIEMPDISELKNPADAKKLKPKAKIEKTTTMMLKYFYAACKKYEESEKLFDVKEGIFSFPVVQEMGGVVMAQSTLEDDEKNA